MAVSSGMSFVLSCILSVLLFSGMQMNKHWLASSQPLTIFGGCLGSLFFILVLTAVGNLETTVFGKTFQTKLVPEVVLCMLVAMTASAMIHRVCITTCFIFSVVALYYINKISQKTYTSVTPQTMVANKRKK